MEIKDTLLSVDLGLKDCLYRIQRDEKDSKRVIYVIVKDLDIIPEESQTYGPDVLRELSRLKEWYDTWETLTVFKDGCGIQSRLNEFEPHALPEQQVFDDYEFFNILDLYVLEAVKARVFRVTVRERRCILKVARFGFELSWLAQEIRAYHMLMQRRSTLVPRLLGYAFEGKPRRVIGFIFEEIVGRRAGIADLTMCKRALDELHNLDIIHGDLNRDNIFITSDGAKFIDLEESCIGPVGKPEEWEKKKSEEFQSLAENLADDSGRGRPLQSDS